MKETEPAVNQPEEGIKMEQVDKRNRRGPRFVVKEGMFGFSTEIYFGIEFENGVHMALPATMEYVDYSKPVHVTTKPSQPMLSLDRIDARDALQSLMDELWKFGVRPKDIGTAGHLAATQKHLEDFRAIVSKQLDVKLPCS